jgi:uncharacterized delta-60 repeat protein
VFAAAVQPDGKYLFAGSCRFCPASDYFTAKPFVARLRANGSIDKTFGADGWALGPWLSESESEVHAVRDLTVDSTGRIFALVKSGDPTGAVQVVRLLQDGRLDPTWSGDGVAVLSDDPLRYGSELGLDPASGAVYAAIHDIHDDVERIHRLLATGEIDFNFSIDGRLQLADGVHVAEMLVDPSGKLLAIGDADGERFWLARILPNGTPDLTFHFDGFNQVEFDLAVGGADCGVDAILSGTKLVTVGSAMTQLGREAFAILRTD